MREERTFAAVLACPTCGVPGRHVAVAREASLDPVGMSRSEEPTWEVRVHDCSTCWRRRAQFLAMARAGLRASGELGETSQRQPTWQGAIVRDACAHDPITGALSSELLRLGLRPMAGAVVRLSARSLGLTTDVGVG